MPTWKPEEPTYKKDFVVEYGKWLLMSHYENALKLKDANSPERKERRAYKSFMRNKAEYLKQQHLMAPLAMRCLTRGLRAACNRD